MEIAGTGSVLCIDVSIYTYGRLRLRRREGRYISFSPHEINIPGRYNSSLLKVSELIVSSHRNGQMGQKQEEAPGAKSRKVHSLQQRVARKGKGILLAHLADEPQARSLLCGAGAA